MAKSQLNFKKARALQDWVAVPERRKRIENGELALDILANAAECDLRFPVTGANIEGALEVMEISRPKRERRAEAEKDVDLKQLRADLDRLTRLFDNLLVQLGEPKAAG